MKGKPDLTSALMCSTSEEERFAHNRLCEMFGVQSFTSRDLVSMVNDLLVRNKQLEAAIKTATPEIPPDNERVIVSPFVAFLYQVMRDHVTLGIVESIVHEQEVCITEKGASNWELSNKHLEGYAREIEARLSQQLATQRKMRGEHDPQ